GVVVPTSRYLARLLDEMGYHARVAMMQPGPFFGRLFSGDFDAVSNGWEGDYPAPDDFLDIFTCGNDPGGYCSRRYDHLVQQATRVELRNPQNPAVAQAERYLVQQAPFVPLFDEVTPNIVSKHVGNVQINPWLGALYDQMWVK